MSEQKAWICFKCSKEFIPTNSSFKCPSCGSNSTIPVERKVTPDELSNRRLIEVQNEEADQEERIESERIVGNQTAEYKVVTDSDNYEFENKLNELGAKGWFLVTSYTKGPRNTVFVAIMEKKD